MNAQRLDHFAREAATAISRRRSLITLGSAASALAALSVGATRETAIAGKGKKCRKRAQKKVKKTCRRQVSACQQAVDEGCAESVGDPEVCRELLLPCCDPLATCDAGASYACVFEALSTN